MTMLAHRDLLREENTQLREALIEIARGPMVDAIKTARAALGIPKGKLVAEWLSDTSTK